MSDAPPAWQKASRSIASGACVEMACEGMDILLRSSRDQSVVLRFTSAEMAAFVDAIRNGEFDHMLP